MVLLRGGSTNNSDGTVQFQLLPLFRCEPCKPFSSTARMLGLPLDSALQSVSLLTGCEDGGDTVQVDVQLVKVETWNEMQRMCTHQHIEDGVIISTFRGLCEL